MTTTADRPGQRPADHYRDDGVFNLNAVAAEAQADPFVFEYGPAVEGDPDGNVWQLAPILDLDYRLVERADSGEVEAVRQVISDRMEAAEQGQWKRFDRLDLGIGLLDKLFAAWLDHNGLKPGESRRSSTSSGATGTRSRQASRGKGRR
jgi:hypothetical protein